MGNITDAEYAAALEAGQRAAETEFRASSVSYLREHDAIEVMLLGRRGGFVIPKHLVGALQDVGPDDLAKMELWPDGSMIEIDDLDIHLAVHEMIVAVLLSMVPRRVTAGIFAAQGGAARSQAKAASSRENGRKGGRPTKKAA